MQRRRRSAGVIHNGHHREIDGIDLNGPRTYYISYYIIMYVYIYNNKYYIMYDVRGLRRYICIILLYVYSAVLLGHPPPIPPN